MPIVSRLFRCVWFWILVSSSLSPAMSEEAPVPQDITFLSKLDATEQRYVVLLPPEFKADGFHDVMIALHGHGSDRWQFISDDRGECKGTRDFAAEHHMIFVSPDYRAKTSWMGPAATADILQILDELHGRYRIRNVIFSGGSMGGTSALAFATMHPECVDGVIALNGTANLVEYSNFPEAIAESFGGSKADRPEIYRQRSAELFPERLTMPVAATTGGRDTLVPPDSTLRLVDALKKQGSPVLSLHRADGGHDTDYDDTRSACQFVFDQLEAAREEISAGSMLDFEQDTTLVCLGDSVTGVYYHTGGLRAYPEMLEIALKATHPDASLRVINAGISGHTTVEGLARLDADVLQHQPALVTISFGLNDMVRVPAEQYRSNLVQLIDRCQAARSRVILCTPNAVIDTDSRPITRLVEYCSIIRDVGKEKNVLVCDQYAAGERLKQRAPWTWRLTMSDAIHPNMDGHKRMAEELCRSISGIETSLDSVPPPFTALARTQKLLQDQMPLRILAMGTVAPATENAVRRLYPNAKIETSVWDIAGKTISQLEQEAKAMVRTVKPDLVVLTLPPAATAEATDSAAAADRNEQTVHSISWIMNWSLSFGRQEWDCIVVHPSVTDATERTQYGELIRRLVHAQHLVLVDRKADDGSAAETLLLNWFESRLGTPFP